MKKRKYSLIILSLILALLVSGCTNQVQQDNPTPENEAVVENQQPAEGGNLKLSVTRFNTANPLFNSNRSLQQMQHLIYEGLVTFNEQLDVEPLLAKSWKIAGDGQSVNFTLRDDVKWHDGQYFTAEDVVFTYQVIKGNIKDVQGLSIYRMSLQQISDMRVEEDGTLKVTFTRPFSNGLEVMSFPIIPKHLFGGAKVAELTNENFPIIGTGPYELEDHQRMKSLKLKKNANYWGDKPYIDTVEVAIVPDTEAQLSLFENGELDFARPVSIDWGIYSDKKNVNVYEFVSNNYEFIGFNFKNGLLQNLNVRKAFAYGIDRHKMVKNIYLDHATVAEVPINPQSWLYDEAGLQYGYDVETAKKTLDEAGFTLGENAGVRSNEEGDQLSFKLVTNQGNLLREKTAYLIQEEMAAVGIELEVVFLEWEAFNEAITKGDYDIVLGGWELAHVPDLSFAFHSSRIGETNFISYSNETMDVLLEEAFKSPNREAKLKHYQALQKHIVSDLPYFSLFFQNDGILVKDHVKGDKGPNSFDVFKNINEWYINTKAE
ncbi:peptide ABC transporter substrate-binding protein [Alkaliphilus hydrothermalis]|uniref:Peptide/nickel transport system substrate-binding protein n=1 Tax=Alkaliphilus hydrothermalis TaxID=1482730 RepID=A0ABS2NPF1_9FIRM|nr:peptide ABC transporter substrate-binding protein [Alkaliphilus hydrothermalis]MBM7614823.1 peptide/nickel transport system substrate-binding protein [Alkaliphilus hydrothermalis]